MEQCQLLDCLFVQFQDHVVTRIANIMLEHEEKQQKTKTTILTFSMPSTKTMLCLLADSRALMRSRFGWTGSARRPAMNGRSGSWTTISSTSSNITSTCNCKSACHRVYRAIPTASAMSNECLLCHARRHGYMAKLASCRHYARRALAASPQHLMLC